MDPNSGQVLRSLVLESIANDYEDFQMVVHEVTQWAKKREISFSIDEIANTLLDLISEANARAWRLGDAPERIQVTRKCLGDQDVYFIITSKGKVTLADLMNVT